MTRLEKIKQRLTENLNPTFLEVLDESPAHFGHGGYQSEGSHFAVEISAPELVGKSLVESHRLVYQALGNMMPEEIHALRIKIR